MKATERTVVAIRLITAWATDLAAEGRVQRAEKVLSSLGAEEQGSPEVLDLRARMLAQRKHFAEAEALWKQALRLAPDREDFREALALCGKLRKRPRWMAFPRERTAWLGVGVVAALALAGGMLGMRSRSVDSGGGVLRPAELEETLPTAGPKAAPVLAPILKNVSLPGVRQEAGPTTTAVTFEMPLFDGGKKLLPEAREVLAALSEGLAAEGEALIVEVVGHTDSAAVPPGRAFVDNPALALARAMIIAEALRRNTGLSEEIFLIRAGAAKERPWKDSDREPDRRNRSVTVKVSRRSSGE